MKTEIASKQEFDFDAFAIGQWDIKLPSLLIRRRQRSPSPARSRPVCSRADQIKKVALEDSILEYQKDRPKKFEDGEEEREIVGINIQRLKDFNRPFFYHESNVHVSRLPPLQQQRPNPASLNLDNTPTNIKKPPSMPTFQIDETFGIQDSAHGQVADAKTRRKSEILLEDQLKLLQERPAMLTKVERNHMRSISSPRPRSSRSTPPKSPKPRPKSTRSVKEVQKDTSPSKDESKATNKDDSTNIQKLAAQSSKLFQTAKNIYKVMMKKEKDPAKRKELEKAWQDIDTFSRKIENASKINHDITALDNKDIQPLADFISNCGKLDSNNLSDFMTTLPEMKRHSAKKRSLDPEAIRKLSSNLIVPKQKLNLARHQEEIREEEEEEEEGPILDTSLFTADFDTLFKRQEALKKNALGIADLDNITLARDIARYPVDDLLDLIWNMFIHIRIMYEDVLPSAFGNAIYGAFRSDKNQTKDDYIRIIIELCKALPREKYLSLQSLTGHLQRIVSCCSGGIGGPLALTRSLSHVFANLFYRKKMPHTGDKYISPKLQLRTINFDSDENLSATKDSPLLSAGPLNREEARSVYFEGDTFINPYPMTMDKLPPPKSQSRPSSANSRPRIVSNSKSSLLSDDASALSSRSSFEMSESLSQSSSFLKLENGGESRRGSFSGDSGRGSVINGSRRASLSKDNIFPATRRSSVVSARRPSFVPGLRRGSVTTSNNSTLMTTGSQTLKDIESFIGIINEESSSMERGGDGNGTRNTVNVRKVEFEKDKSSSPTRQGHRRGSIAADDQKGPQKGGALMRGRSFADRQRAVLFEPTPSSRKFRSVAPPKKDVKIVIDVFADGEAEKSTKQEEPMSIAKQRWIMAFQKIVDKLPKKRTTSFKIVKNFANGEEKEDIRISVAEPIIVKSPPKEKKTKKKSGRDLSDRQKSDDATFDWDKIVRESVDDLIVNQQYVLNPYGASLEIMISYWDDVFAK